jgi:hypothetical protein
LLPSQSSVVAIVLHMDRLSSLDYNFHILLLLRLSTSITKIEKKQKKNNIFSINWMDEMFITLKGDMMWQEDREQKIAELNENKDFNTLILMKNHYIYSQQL